MSGRRPAGIWFPPGSVRGRPAEADIGDGDLQRGRVGQQLAGVGLAGVAEHFTRLLSVNRTVVADGPAALVRDAGVLRATYGGHLIEVDHGEVVMLDDPHHRDGVR